jgi:high-affinity iron transporter
MLNALVVVWRESFEAILVMGILAAALRLKGVWARGRLYMAAGVCAGIVLAVLLALGLMYAQTELQGAALEYFQVAMMLVAAFLIVHMCLWMKKHGRELKRGLERSVEDSVETGNMWSLALITALAIGREGMETVLFLYGTGLEAFEKGEVGALAGASGAGLLLAMATGWVISRGLRNLDQKWFFRVSTGLLLLLAGGLVIQTANRLVQNEVLPPLRAQVWDTSWLLDERSTVGEIVSLFTGYQSSPALSVLLCYAAFWVAYILVARALSGREKARAR